MTLVEIAVVIAILVVLGALIWKSTRGLDQQSKIREQKEVFTILDSGLQAYYEVKGTFPVADGNEPVGAADDATSLVVQQVVLHTQALYAALTSEPEARQVLATLPRKTLSASDPPAILDQWGRPLDYRWTQGMTFPILESAGPNGWFEAAGTPSSDDMTNRE